MNLPRVVNLKVDKADVVIDRRSKWGNPFRMILKGDDERKRVIDRYRTWILKQDHLLLALGELAGKRLGCWCHPKACHGHVLVELFKIANRWKDEPAKSVRSLSGGDGT